MSNSISFVGRLVRDAELKTVGSSQVCEFTAANDQGYKDKKTTIFFRCALWGKQGESLCQYLTKAKQVWVSGELVLREYDAKGGSKKTSADVRVSAIDLVGGRSDGDASTQDNATKQERRPAPASNSTSSAPQEDSALPF